MKHTQEPWNTSKHGTPDYCPQFGIYSEGARNDLATVKGDNAEADAARIVACVNACVGIEDPAAELAAWKRTAVQANQTNYEILAELARLRRVEAAALALLNCHTGAPWQTREIQNGAFRNLSVALEG